MTTRTESVDTPAGEARVTWHPADAARLVLAVGHGAGGGIEARDLQALAAALPGRGITVALVEQPWRVAGKKVAAAPKVLDEGWRALWPALLAAGPPVVAGGRSAGARVACRTAAGLGAAGVLALAFPLHPPGRPEKSRAEELLGAGRPTLVVQGGRDPFGHPDEFPPAGPGPGLDPGLAAPGARPGPRTPYELVAVPHGDHGFAVPKRADVTQAETLAAITGAVAEWLDRLPLR
ncbi:alpha/beta family hydrolase [Streptomyces sp. NPDC091259]|uniref:alpha/beta hydrolase family protein n=1 Tax=Streptomyces sp. NPDC091259 TaxID=3365976 RepID=UPI0037F549E1